MMVQFFGTLRWRAVRIAVLALFGIGCAAASGSARADDFCSGGPTNAPGLSGDWGGWRKVLADKGVTPGLVEQSELWTNLTGGKKQGITYDGRTTASLAIDLDKLVGWNRGQFYASAYQIHGRGPTANLVGNAQVVSNIEATRDTKLYDLWIDQCLLNSRLSLRFGQGGADEEVMTSRYSAVFLNASFGFAGLTAADLPSGGPVYPLATPFARAKLKASDELTFLAAVFNGDPAPPGPGDPQRRDAGGTAFRLNDHALGFTEAWYSVGQGKGELPGTYKLGAWYSTSPFADQRFDTAGLSLGSPASTGIPRTHSPGYGFYGLIDQMIWRPPGAQDGKGVAVFFRVMAAPAAFNLSNLFIDGGLTWTGLFEGRDSDVAGIGASYLGISPAAQGYSGDLVAFTGSGSRYSSNETVVELTYLYHATDWFSLQPDLQYVVNPNAGIPAAPGGRHLGNALVVGVQASVTF